ncbi:methyltransferase domain-containing protein [Pelagicoccus mobilis]|uniref:Methyltransferase domain-containing protein n=1 Tax=Pelagicoccus mobilis TaxID=415221 RepID=A0A934S2V0_9BACT|nr:methyltransferase domain-containing protein [Pelagicoccus mobilis]MBK1878409.1 methyltransferase domain-containing protein [Pelagicoccus mobilis]
MQYFDVRDRDESVRLFDELDPSLIVDVDVVGDVDQRDLRKIGEGCCDFTIANHVIEHLANPIALVEDMFYITKPGGLVVLSAPDKRFTYDKKRDITPFQHLLEDYWNRETRADDSHYLDFIRKVLPGGEEKEGKALEDLLTLVWKRREHVHVWTTRSFRGFMFGALDHLGIQAEPIVELDGDDTRFEYFSIWQKAESGFIPSLLSACR